MTSFNDAVADHREHVRAIRRVPFEFEVPEGDIPLDPASSASPTCRAIPRERDERCYEAYNIQVHGLMKRLEHAKIENIVIGVSGGLDSTQALIVAAKTMDRLGLPREHILGYTMPGFATSDVTFEQRPRAHARAAASPRARSTSGRRCQQMLRDLGHPYARGEPRLRCHLRECAGRRAHLASLPARQLPQRHRARHRRPQRAGAGLVHLRRRRPHVALQRERLGAEDADPAPDPLGHQHRSSSTTRDRRHSPIDPRHGDLARARPARSRRRERAVAEHRSKRSAPTSLQDFNLYYVTRYGFRPSKVAFLSHHAWGDQRAAPGPTACPREAPRVRPRDDQEVAGSLPLPLLPDQPVQAFVSAERPESRLRRLAVPADDWRAPSDSEATVWLEELRKNVPE